jgi:hypothetical protein
VIRHPTPYGNLAAQRAKRFATFVDLEGFEYTIEEGEDYERHIMEGTTVYAGVDYGDILCQAGQEGDFILWHSGNNDTSFYKPRHCGARSAPSGTQAWIQFRRGQPGQRTLSLPVAGRLCSERMVMVGATGFEPVTSTV